MEKYRKSKSDVIVLATKIDGEAVIVKRHEVASYVYDPFFQKVLGIFNYAKLWGMPNGEGWANEPVDMLEAITALELETRAIESEGIENASNGKGSDTGSGIRSPKRK